MHDLEDTTLLARFECFWIDLHFCVACRIVKVEVYADVFLDFFCLNFRSGDSAFHIIPVNMGGYQSVSFQMPAKSFDDWSRYFLFVLRVTYFSLEVYVCLLRNSGFFVWRSGLYFIHVQSVYWSFESDIELTLMCVCACSIFLKIVWWHGTSLCTCDHKSVVLFYK